MASADADATFLNMFHPMSPGILSFRTSDPVQAPKTIQNGNVDHLHPYCFRVLLKGFAISGSGGSECGGP